MSYRIPLYQTELIQVFPDSEQEKILMISIDRANKLIEEQEKDKTSPMKDMLFPYDFQHQESECAPYQTITSMKLPLEQLMEIRFENNRRGNYRLWDKINIKVLKKWRGRG